MTRSNIAAIVGAESAVIQKLLAQAIVDWRAEGLKVCGLVEEAHGLTGRSCSAGLLRNIQTDNVYAMYLDEPPAHTSCHLDELGVVGACSSVLGQIEESDVVVLSKFGKVEAVGSGLFEAFEHAIASGKPVLTSVAPKHHYAWTRFAPDAVFIRPERAAFDEWLGNATRHVARGIRASVSLHR